MSATVLAGDENSGILEGRVLDRETSDPVAYAYLHIEELNRTITAHSDGTFQFNNLPAGTYTLSVHRIGYQTLSQKVTIADDETTEITVSLKPTVLNSEAVEVIGSAERGRFQPGTCIQEHIGNRASSGPGYNACQHAR
ncbi:MAG: carboxypeptidase-like regulatory domain-containing protein [Balneolaceae bacterium]|nr:carboxypeptidase-like regulatory domain-containing protein [Balneolaceae bacterium]